MKNTFGNLLTVTLFGESHGEQIGVVVDGLPAGIPVPTDEIRRQLERRKANGNLSTARLEQDDFHIVSGYFHGKTTGTPLTVLMENNDTDDKNDANVYPRPGHADFVAHHRYGGFEDYRGGGHFSGRMTAPLVAVGAICLNLLQKKGIEIASHIQLLGGFSDKDLTEKDVSLCRSEAFPVLDGEVKAKMQNAILNAKKQGDSIGGVTETKVFGMPIGVGEPWFDSLEGMLSHAIFSIPAVKGMEFGDGFSFANGLGSSFSDNWIIKDGKTVTDSNHNGGINGGMSNGMPIVFRTVIKPTPSISVPQTTVDYRTGEERSISLQGRFDPCILSRSAVILDSVTAFVLTDALMMRFGEDYFRE